MSELRYPNETKAYRDARGGPAGPGDGAATLQERVSEEELPE
jgi:hypothetical protein